MININRLLEVLISIIWLLMWVAGTVLAKGFWSTFFAVCTGGIWSLYLVVEKLINTQGLV